MNAPSAILDEVAWQDRLDRLPGYSFFATPTWGRIISGAGLGYRHQALEFDLHEGRALLTLAFRKIAGRLVMQSGPFGTYGGLIPLDGSDEATWSRLGATVARRFRAMPGFGVLLAYPGPRLHVPFPEVFDRYEAFVIELPGPVDESDPGILAGMRRKTRQYIHKAERDGVEVTSDDSKAAFEVYYQLLCDTARRWGRAQPGKPWSMFESIRSHSDPRSARLWLAHVGGKPAAGLLCFYGKGEVFAWSAALARELVDTRANYLLHWRAIADAAARGFQIFNLGANEGLEGVRWFKEGFGARPREYPAYVVGGVPYTTALWALRQTRSLMHTVRSTRG